MKKPTLTNVSSCIDYIQKTLKAWNIDASFIDAEFQLEFEDEVVDKLEFGTMVWVEDAMQWVVDDKSYREVLSTYATNYYTVLEELTLDVIADHYIVV